MGRKILVACGNAIERKELTTALQSDFNIAEAENGVDVFSFLNTKSRTISAIVLDVDGVELYGFEILRRIKEHSEWSLLPLIVLTEASDDQSRIKIFKLGADGLNVKPYNKKELLYKLHNLIRMREAASISNSIARDKKTGLPNRECFFEESRKYIDNEIPGYYVMSCVDIDNFKIINDQYGVKVGDGILRHVGEVIRDAASKIDGLCCRFTADKFAMLYPADKIDSEIIHSALSEAKNPPGIDRGIGVRIGRYLVDNTSISIGAMFDRATMAEQSIRGVYGKSVATYDDDMRANLLHEQKIISEMQFALQDGQFEIWFQPQFNHLTSALIGAEALVRWHHPKRGIISPATFIPVFERNGFIFELDKYVWETTCKYLRRWIDEGRTPMPVSVNVSRVDVFKPELIDVLSALIERYDLPIDLLRLEITESAFSESAEQIISTVKNLIKRGFTVEIDDFGSGYSSLNTLKDVPAQILKLDMKFLEDHDDIQRGGSIVESIIRMAKWLGMSVIAEGVETKEQADYLKSIGCYYNQGFYYSKALPWDRCVELLEHNRIELELQSVDTVRNFNNTAFWDNKSLDTMVFNHFSGGAYIFEYHKGRFETLRVNDEFAKTFNSKLESGEILKREPFSKLDTVDFETVKETVDRASESDKAESCEIFSSTYVENECEGEYIKLTVRRIASVGDRFLFYGYVENTTALHNAEKRSLEAAEKAEVARDQLSFSNEILGILLAQPDTETGILIALKHIMSFFDADRAYLIEFTKDLKYSSNTYEVCAGGVSAQKANLQNIPTAEAPFLPQVFDNNRAIQIDVANLEGDMVGAKSLLESQGIHSLVAVPMYRNGEYLGFVGVDEPSEKQQIEYLTAIGDCMSIMLMRRDINRALTEESQAMTAIMDGVPGGFIRMKFLTEELFKPVYISGGFKKLVRMTDKQINDVYGNNAMDGIYPDDKYKVRRILSKILAGEVIYNERLRLVTGDGGFIWTTVNGRTRKSDTGEMYLNNYYSDASAEIEAESIRISLLDNLPCIAALFSFDGKNLRAKHINKRYWEQLGGNPYDVKGVLDGAFPDDRNVIMEELRMSINEERNFSADVRVLNGKGQYTPFNITAYVEEQEDGTHLFYAAYKQLSSEIEKQLRVSEQECRVAIESNDIFAARYDIEQKRLYTSQNRKSMYGLSGNMENIPEASIQRGLVSKRTADDVRAFFKAIHDGEEGGSVRYKRKFSDEWHWMEAQFTNIFDSEGKSISAIITFYDVSEEVEHEAIYKKMFEDIDRYKRSELELKAQAENDALTGILNRSAFEAQAKEALAKMKPNERAAMLMLDVDGFKTINDTLGHSVGDKALVDTVDYTSAILRRKDLFGRFGGDEFLILLTNIVNIKNAEAKAHDICKRTCRELSEDIKVSVSIGIAMAPDDARDFNALYEKADEALYYVKKNGKNNYRAYSHIDNDK